MFVLDDLFVGLPLKAFLGIFEKIYELAQAELTDEAKIKEELLRLQTLYELDQLSEEEYTRQETLLLERLTAIREASA